ncbi:uncharacterized protein LOC115975476 [Quercus lobata]|uniref:uncharacterized protein LOC115975476 n=1 Tax=Quercus lobata TaxID=97700 RepID=UPI00124447F8|nr:uncharacterized protein LOC115975476 [Quercus lobata]
MASSWEIGLRSVFAVLGCLMLATLIYTISIDDLPFRKDLLTPWMVATLVDFYINVVPLAAWILYKEPKWITAIPWIILLVCFGSITTCAYILMQLLKVPSEQNLQDPMDYVLLRHPGKDDTQQKRNHSFVVTLRILFVILGCLMLGTLVYTLLTDGSPFRKELLTPWMIATLVDFYINVVALSVWVYYKESSWISAMIWIILLVSFGSITTSVYIALKLFQLTSQDPIYLVLLNSYSGYRKCVCLWSSYGETAYGDK